MKRLRSPKFCAALVMIAWVAAVVSFWGLDAASLRSIAKDGHCCAKDLEHVGFRLEMTSDIDKALPILDGDETCTIVSADGKQIKPAADKRAACIRNAFAAEVKADSVLIPSYSLFFLTLFFFVRSLRGAPRWSSGLIVVGVLLATTIFVTDFMENHQLERLIELTGQPRSPENLSTIEAHLGLLQTRTFFKLGAVALASGILVASWFSRSGSLLVWAPRLLGVAAAVLFVAAMVDESWCLGIAAMGTSVVFGLAGVIHAIAVISTSYPQPGGSPQ